MVNDWVADLLPENKSGTLMPSSDELHAEAHQIERMDDGFQQHVDTNY